MRSRHDRLPNTSGSVPTTGTLGRMSTHCPPTGQSTPHVHSQFAKSTPSKPATSQLWDSQGQLWDGRGYHQHGSVHIGLLNTPEKTVIGPHLLTSARQP